VHLSEALIDLRLVQLRHSHFRNLETFENITHFPSPPSRDVQGRGDPPQEYPEHVQGPPSVHQRGGRKDIRVYS